MANSRKIPESKTTETVTTKPKKPRTSVAKTKKVTEDIVSESPKTETTAPAPKYKRKRAELGVQVRNAEQIPLDALITVRNMTAGRLIYSGRHMAGYTIPWETYGETREIEMRELFNMKNTDSMFFKENWVEVDPVVLENLHMDQYYKNAISYDEIEDMPYGSIDIIRERFDKQSNVIKYSIVTRARAFIESGELSDIRLIQQYEDIFGCKLTMND